MIVTQTIYPTEIFLTAAAINSLYNVKVNVVSTLGKRQSHYCSKVHAKYLEINIILRKRHRQEYSCKQQCATVDRASSKTHFSHLQ